MVACTPKATTPADAQTLVALLFKSSSEKFVALKSRNFFSLFVILFSDFRSERKEAPKMAGLKPELLQAVAIHLVLCCFLWCSKAQEENSKDHENIPSPVLRLSEIALGLNSQPGLSHIVLAGANEDGMKEVEVWLTTYAPGSGTPIHRHACEEVFIVLKGSGTLYISPASDALFPGKPQTFPIYPNSTFIVPVESVHQVRNTMDSGDLQALIALSQPPMKSYIYKDWNTAHEKAKLFDFASVEQHRSIPQYYRASEPEAHQEL